MGLLREEALKAHGKGISAGTINTGTGKAIVAVGGVL
jgi:hypothetical protein